MTAGHAQAPRDALARYDGPGRCPAASPGQTQDTGERVDGTEVRDRQRRRAPRSNTADGCPLNWGSSSRPSLDSKVQDTPADPAMQSHAHAEMSALTIRILISLPGCSFAA